MTVTIHAGDCLDVLRTLPDASVHCCVTSPPYFALRDYGVPPTDWPPIVYATIGGAVRVKPERCCLGLERSPEAFIGHMVLVFREVRRVLRDDGTLWLNIGDSYASGGGTGAQGSRGERFDRRHTQETLGEVRAWRESGIKPKDMLGIPWMLAFALRADGWFLRQDVIWSKPNPMPESAKDRCTKAHEYLFLLAKSRRYYFNARAISEPRSSVGDVGVAGWAAGDGDHSAIGHNKGDAKTFRGGQYVGGNKFENSHATVRSSRGNRPVDSTTRNRRSVWEIATRGFSGAHFATFPPALVEPCILAGCPVGGVVLDPFGGAGTTGLVAEAIGRDSVLIEIGDHNVAMSRERIVAAAPLVNRVEVA